jgi:Ran GTPase-activating protein (RanGAP) involved in mRNA processing and transport
VAAARSGLEHNTTLRDFSLLFWQLDIFRSHQDSSIVGFTPVLKALGCRPTLTRLTLRGCRIGSGEVRLLQKALFSIPSLQSLALTGGTLENAGLADIAPALYHNTSIKELVLSSNMLDHLDSAILLRDIIRRNKTVTTLDLSWNKLGRTVGAVECVGDGLGSNSTLLKIELRGCALGDDGISALAQSLASRSTRLQKLGLRSNAIKSTGFGALIESMEQSSQHITDLDLDSTLIGIEGSQ